MGALATLTLYFVVFGSVYGLLTQRFIRTIRQGDEDWRKRWRALEPATRRQILRTMRRGDPVVDSEDAELGLRAVAQNEFVHRAMRPLEAFSGPSMFVLLAIGIVTGDLVIVFIAAPSLIAFGLLTALSTWRRRRLDAGAEATRRLHAVDVSPG